MSRARRYAAATPLVLFLLLAVPLPDPPVAPAPPDAEGFAWRSDSLWDALEEGFLEARVAGCGTGEVVGAELAELNRVIGRLSPDPLGPEAPVFDTLETRLFRLGAIVAACPDSLRELVHAYGRMRQAVKRRSRDWDMGSTAARARLYRALYGGRAAVEEVMFQHPGRAATLLPGTDEPSATPSATVEGVRVHSGDLLVSRGGYPTSALIARGNDYPGNFSHVGLVHVEETSGEVSVVEALIARGVVVTPADRYLADKKLRIMLLRPRADLPRVAADPMLPHRAATLAITRARAGHIPYDFAMDYTDPSRQFCSEVASSVYGELGVTLWTGLSTISAEGLRRWLWGFGVRHFETQEPSDLEYDPQLAVVAEWRNPDALRQDRIDNAVVDAMLERANLGMAPGYAWYKLPVARVLAGYSAVARRLGWSGPIPEGMSPAAALRNDAFTARQRQLAQIVGQRADVFRQERGYPPPYWRLLDMARTATE